MAFSSSDDSSGMMDDIQRVVSKISTQNYENPPKQESPNHSFFSSQDSFEADPQGKENAGCSPAKAPHKPSLKDPWEDDDDDFPSICDDAIDALIRQHQVDISPPLNETCSPNIPQSIQVQPSDRASSCMSDIGGCEGLDDTDSFLLEMDRSLLEDTIVPSPPSDVESNLPAEDLITSRPVKGTTNVFRDTSEQDVAKLCRSSSPKSKRSALADDSSSSSLPRSNKIQVERVSSASAARKRNLQRSSPPPMKGLDHRRGQTTARDTTASKGKQHAAFSPDSSSSEDEAIDHSSQTRQEASTFFRSQSSPHNAGPSLGSTSSSELAPTIRATAVQSKCNRNVSNAASPGKTEKSTTSNHRNSRASGTAAGASPALASTSDNLDDKTAFVFKEPSSCEAEYEFCDPTSSIPDHQQPAPALDAFGFPVDPDEEMEEAEHSLNHTVAPHHASVTHQQVHEQVSPLGQNQVDIPATGRPSEVDASKYPPQPRSYEEPPIVHTFDARSRPLTSRVSIPVSKVFDIRVSGLWRNKFDTFNHLQSELANMVAYSDDNVVCSAPTGAGKTALFEMALARFYAVDLQTPGSQATAGKVSNRRKAVYVSPSKALCEERYEDWSRRFAAMNLGIQVAVITGDGDPSESFNDLTNAHFILTTPEKWESLTRRWTENFFLFASVKIFLVDEVHLIADENRGCCLESIVSRMKIIQQTARRVDVTQEDLSNSSYTMTTPEAIGSPLRFVAVSATLPNIAEIAQFFDANECHVFDKTYRPVPLQIHVIGQGILGGKSGSEFHFSRNLDRNVPDIVAKFSSGRPSIVFCHSKNDTEKLADILATDRIIGNRTRTTSEIASRTRISKLQRVLLHGIAYHHAGLDLNDRRVVEQAFKDGNIRVLCATSTLAMGVNLPAHLVVVKGTRAWRGTTSGYQNIDQASLLQMIGRAGRPGFDTSGTVVIMTDNESKQKFQSLASSGLEPARSKCVDNKFVETLNAEISQRVVTCMDTAIGWVKGTLLYVQMYSSGATSAHAIDSYLYDLCKMTFSKLEQISAIIVRGESVYPLAACHVMSHNLVDYSTMLRISQLPFDANQCQLLKSLSMIEGLQRPLRRSEKKSLNAAHKDVPHKLEGVPSKVRVKEPWEKAFVLFQVSIAELALEGNDFTLRQEMRSMVDFASRMLAAVEEYSTNGTRNGNVAMQSLRLRRSLAVKLWCGRTTGTLKQINGVSKSLAFQLSNHGISTFEDVVKSSNEKIEQAAGRMSPFGKDLRKAAERILQSSLTIAGSLETAHESTTPSTLVCKIQRKALENLTETENRSTGVSYTLFVYTDQEGGCLLFEENITGPCEFTTAVPLRYGKIFLRLMGSVVGVDDAMEISGNSDFATSLGAERGSAPRIRNTGKKPKARNVPTTKRRKLAPNERTQLTLTEMGQRSKRREFSKATVTPPRESSASPVCTGIKSVDRREDQRTKMDQLTPVQGGFERPSPLLLHGGEIHAARDQNHVQARIPHASDPNCRGRPNARDQANIQRTPPPPSRSLQQKWSAQQLPSTESRSSWKKAKIQQERSQRRAFVRKKDNPFALYSHDPNNAESALDELASQTDEAAQTSIIPAEILRQSATSQFQPNNFQRRQIGQGKQQDRRSTVRQSNGGYSQPAAGMYGGHSDNYRTGEMSAPTRHYAHRSKYQSTEGPPSYYQDHVTEPHQMQPASSHIQQQHHQPFVGHRTPSIARGYHHTRDVHWRASRPPMETAPYHRGPPAMQPAFQSVTQSPPGDWQHSHVNATYMDEYGASPQDARPMMNQHAPPFALVDDYYKQHDMTPQHLSGWDAVDEPPYFQQGGMQHGVSQEEFESAFF